MRYLAMALLLMVVSLLIAFAPPPSGRPPIGPLSRIDPKLYDLKFDVTISTILPHVPTNRPPTKNPPMISTRENYHLVDAPIVMPVIFMGTYSKVLNDSVQGRIWLNNQEVDSNFELKSGYPFGTYLATMTIRQFNGKAIRWDLRYRTQSWSSKLDDQWAAQITWPREWPEEVRDGLQPQLYIESDHEVFKAAVEKLTNGRLRTVPPFLAAKELIRQAILTVQVARGGVERDEYKVIRGMIIDGALEAWNTGLGSPHDLVCACVALLRAAGIPARPVIGVVEDDKDKATFVSWAEFYLPEAGWVPFDPDELRGKAIRTLDVHRPWPELGTMDDLNERVVLGYNFMPAATVESPRAPAVWGWDPRPGGDPNSDVRVHIELTSRGKGQDDPR